MENFIRIRTMGAAVAIAAIFAGGNFVGADEGSPADVMPGGAFGYVELDGMEKVIADVKGSRLVAMLPKNEDYKNFIESDQGKKFLAGKLMAEGLLGMDLWDAGGKMFGGTMAAGLYPQAGSEEPAFLAFVRPADARSLAKPKQIFAAFLEGVEKDGGVEIFRPKGGGKAEFLVAVGEDWLAMATQRELLDGCLGLVSGGKGEALSEAENFAQMTDEMGGGHLGRVFVNTDRIAEFTDGRMGMPEKLDEPMLSLLVGGLLELAVNSPYAGMALDYEDGEIVLSAGVSGSSGDLPEQFEAFFAGAEDGAAVPAVDGLVGGFTMHRDIAAWYASRENLIADVALPGFDKFEAGIGNLLPGKDFGQDVLPLIGKNVRFVMGRQSYEHLGGSKPGVQLPGFALVFDLEKPEEAADIFQLTFQSLMAITNFQAAQEGRTPSVVEADLYKGVKYSAARNLEKPDGGNLDLAFNFLPAAARVGDEYILSSSLELCKSLIDTLQSPDADKPTGKDAEMVFEMDQTIALLKANRKHLVAGEIKKGKSAAEAKKQIDGLMQLLGLFESVTMDTGKVDGGYRLRMAAKLK